MFPRLGSSYRWMPSLYEARLVVAQVSNLQLFHVRQARAVEAEAYGTADWKPALPN
jgi:hypothetical protein